MALVNRLSFNPFIVKFFARHWYPFLTRTFGADEAVFLNMGYEEDPPMALPLRQPAAAGETLQQTSHTSIIGTTWMVLTRRSGPNSRTKVA